MIVESIDIIADWFADGTYGVNALLGAVPRGHSDTAPPNLANIFAETRNDEVAEGKLPEEQAPTIYPALIITRPETIGIITPVRTARWDGQTEILIGYAVREVASAKGLRNCGYTLRAALRSLWKLEDPSIAAAQAARSPAGLNITLRGFDEQWRLLGVQAPMEDKTVLGGLIIRVNMEDTLPGG